MRSRSVVCLVICATALAIAPTNPPRAAEKRTERWRGGIHSVMGDVLAWLVIGLIAGILANVLVGGRSTGGCISSIVVGLLGAVVGGFIFDALGLEREFTWLGSILVATVGAVIILWALRALRI